MEAIIDWLSTLETLSPWLLYLVILGIAYGENVMPPIPGDLVVVYGGYLAGVGTLHFGLVVLIATIGGALGFMTMFGVGWKAGEAVMDENRLRWLPKQQIARANEWMGRWGYGLVLANRFLSGMRSVISLAVGIARKDVARVGVYCTISAFVWVALIAYGGYVLGENYTVVIEYLRVYGRIVLGLTVAAAAVYLFVRYRRARRGGEERDAAPGGPVQKQ